MGIQSNRYDSRLTAKKKRSKKKIFFLAVFVFSAYALYDYFFLPDREFSEASEKPKFGQLASAPLVYSQVDATGQNEMIEYHTITEGDIPAEVFSIHGKWDANDTAALLHASEEIYDFTKLKLGQTLRFYFEGEERASRMEYEPNKEKIIIAERSGDDFYVREEAIKYDVNQVKMSGTIDEFFYKDALDAGISEATIVGMADMFSFSIDFTTEIRQGDQFSVVYEKRKRDGKNAPDGKILAAKFINDGSEYRAYYFGNDEDGGYYDQEGHELAKQFLKAPLSFVHITSGFTGARLHPITKQVTAHYQIDYAAPTGTPVVATARGTVSSAGWENGWGYIVRMRHDNGYTTHYAHLSNFAKNTKRGASIAQGQIIGYVGSTGWSTGPHLDYGVKLNGTPVNPLKMDLPKGESLSSDKMREFEEIKKKFDGLL